MNRTKLTVLAAALTMTAGVAPLAAQSLISPRDRSEPTRVATRGANFLRIGVGARAQSLGGAHTALARGISALFWNPAAVAFDEGAEIGLSYSPLYADLDIAHSYGGFILPMGESRIGISLNTLNSGRMVATTENYPAGGDPVLGGSSGEFTWNSTAVALHYAMPVTDRLAVGATGKYITEGISGAHATFLALDLSTIFHLGMFGSTLAASYVNVGTEGNVRGQRVRQGIDQRSTSVTVLPTGRVVQADLETRRVQLPGGVYIGVASELLGGADAVLGGSPDHRVLFAVEGAELDDAPFSPRLGVEYGYRDRFFLRTGKQWANDAQLGEGFGHLAAIGAGVRLPFGERGARFDYAFTNFGRLSNVQVFSFEVSF